jgi:N-acetylmuramic acid 6-phosphate etherase
MALNIISTAVMVRLGKVYGNRMVDVSASNSKLVDRSLRILRDLAAVERDRGLALLDKADGSVKLALLIAVGELEPGAARELLQKHSGQLREALASLGLNLAQS